MERAPWEAEVRICINGIAKKTDSPYLTSLSEQSALMAVDISNYQIGLALAYYRHQKPNESEVYNGNDDNDANAVTTISALPPIPYLSNAPYHPSYAFLHHHKPGGDMMSSFGRVDRTIVIADQLAQLAHDRNVKGILVRWPGDLASTVCGVQTNTRSTRQAEEGQLLFPVEGRREKAVAQSEKSDGSQGYMRGRILYVLDKCCATHGHNQNSVLSDPLLREGSRPFALWDTSHNEQDWITYEQQDKHSRPLRPLIPKRADKYGNSLTEMDLWGRAAIFGNEPPPPMHGKFYYSSKQHYSGYRVSCEFETAGHASKKANLRNENFDSLHDNDSKMNQFQGSLSAMHALYDFSRENLQGQIALPLWATASSSAASQSNSASNRQASDDSLFDEKCYRGVLGQRNSRRSGLGLSGGTSSTVTPPSTSNKPAGTPNSHQGDGRNHTRVNLASQAKPNTKPNGLVSLAQMPKRRRRVKVEAEASSN
ncbi:hypothetical protein ACHAWF_007935 [Thalassiosira exigua]